MDDSKHRYEPKPQSASAGAPPRPPKKTARDLGDDAPDHRKQLTKAEREEIKRWFATHGGQSQ
jgi:hypothetical protein